MYDRKHARQHLGARDTQEYSALRMCAQLLYTQKMCQIWYVILGTGVGVQAFDGAVVLHCPDTVEQPKPPAQQEK